MTVRARDVRPVAFTWRGVTYRVRVIGTWRLATRRWETGAAVDRVYFRVQTADQQIFEVYRERAGMGMEMGIADSAGQTERWVLDVCLD